MKKLEKMNLGRLTVLEFGQHITKVCENLMNPANCDITDEGLLNYIETLTNKLIPYNKAMQQLAKSNETAKIAAADKERDAAITAALRMLSVFELSNNAVEKEAFTNLTNLFNNYKGIQTWNFDEETIGLKNLTDDLTGSTYSPHITALHMETCVNRMKNSNEDFIALFAARTHETAIKEVFDVKTMRGEMRTVYEDMVNYVLAMSKILDTEEFNSALNHINAERKYDADILARYKSQKAPANTPPV